MSVITGGLLQDLEERIRRGLAPIEERVRSGQETRGVAGGAGTGGAATGPEAADERLVIVLPPARATPPVNAPPGMPDQDRR